MSKTGVLLSFPLLTKKKTDGEINSTGEVGTWFYTIEFKSLWTPCLRAEVRQCVLAVSTRWSKVNHSFIPRSEKETQQTNGQ